MTKLVLEFACCSRLSGDFSVIMWVSASLAWSLPALLGGKLKSYKMYQTLPLLDYVAGKVREVRSEGMVM